MSKVSENNQNDFIVRELDKLLVVPHSQDERMKNGDPCFRFRNVQAALIKAQNELQTLQKVNTNKLRQTNEDAIALKKQFCENMQSIDSELSHIYNQSKELSENCTKLSIDFTQITDRLDSATSIVRRADTIATYLRDIIIFNEKDDLESVKKDLKVTTFPLDNPYKVSEYISKLIKIIDITEKKSSVEKAKNNLDEYRNELSMQLLNSFKNKLTESVLNTNELHDCAKALSYLELGHEAIQVYICTSPLFTQKQYIDLQYNEDILNCSFDEIFEKYDKICNAISSVCTKVWNTIDLIFDPTQQVKLKLLQSIFQQLLSNYINEVLNLYLITENNKNNFCLMLEKLYKRTTEMLESIWKLDNQQFSSLNLIDKVFRSFQIEYSQQERFLFNEEMKRLISEPISLLDKIEKQNVITKILQKNEEILDPFSIFDETICSQIMITANLTWERCSLLSLPENIETDLSFIIECFLNNTLYVYIIRFIRCCSQYLMNFNDSKYVGLFLKMLLMVNSTILILDDKYIKSFKGILLHHSSAHSNFLTSKRRLIEQLEKEIVQGLSNCVEVVCSSARKLLSNLQRKHDFLVTQDNFTEPQTTEACKAFVSTIKGLIRDTKDHIVGENKVSFYTMICTKLIEVLREHFLKYKYNNRGSINFQMDIIEYKNVFNLFGIDGLSNKIDFLVASGKLMTMCDLSAVGKDIVNIIPKDADEYCKKMLMLDVDLKATEIEELFQYFQ